MGNVPLKLAATSGLSRIQSATYAVKARRISSAVVVSWNLANTRTSRSMGSGMLNRKRVSDLGAG